MQSGSWLPARPVWLWGALLCFLFWCVLSVQAQQPTEPTIDSWPSDTLPLLPILSGSSERMELLLTRLTERNQEIKNLRVTIARLGQQGFALRQSYAELSEQLKLAENSRDALNREVKEILDSRARLQEDYSTLSFSLDNYSSEAAGQISETRRERDSAVRQARLWRLAAIGGWVGAVVAVAAIVVIVVK